MKEVLFEINIYKAQDNWFVHKYVRSGCQSSG